MASAMEALLELRERQLVEPALEEIATTVAAFLPELPLAARAPMLARLWPLIAQLPSATERMTAFALAWQVGGGRAHGSSGELLPDGTCLLGSPRTAACSMIALESLELPIHATPGALPALPCCCPPGIFPSLRVSC